MGRCEAEGDSSATAHLPTSPPSRHASPAKTTNISPGPGDAAARRQLSLSELADAPPSLSRKNHEDRLTSDDSSDGEAPLQERDALAGSAWGARMAAPVTAAAHGHGAASPASIHDDAVAGAAKAGAGGAAAAELFVAKCGSAELFARFAGQAQTAGQIFARDSTDSRRAGAGGAVLNLKEFLALLAHAAVLPAVVTKSDAVGVFRARAGEALVLGWPEFTDAIARLAALKAYKLLDLAAPARGSPSSGAPRSASPLRDDGLAGGGGGGGGGKGARGGEGSASPGQHMAPAGSAGSAGGIGSVSPARNTEAGGGGASTVSMTEAGVYTPISNKEQDLMVVFEERFGARALYEAFCKGRGEGEGDSGDSWRMDQTGWVALLEYLELMPALISRQEAGALFKAVTRGMYWVTGCVYVHRYVICTYTKNRYIYTQSLSLSLSHTHTHTHTHAYIHPSICTCTPESTQGHHYINRGGARA